MSVYGVTGSILVFHNEIEDYLNSELFTVSPTATQAAYQPLAAIFAAGRQAMPASAKLVFATYPRQPNLAFKLNYSYRTADGIMESRQLAIDPYTAIPIGQRLLSRSDSAVPKTFIGFIFTLHYDLFLGEGISPGVVGVSAALLIISLLTGLIVWWPLTGRWGQALSFKDRAGRVRMNYDLHKLSGFYSAIVLVIVLFSGIYMVLPQQVAAVLELFSPVTYRYWFHSTPPSSSTPTIGADQAVAIAWQYYPGGRPDWIYAAPEISQTYTVCLDGVADPRSWLQRRCIVMDRYSGKILDVDDPATGTAGEVFTHWQWPLHSGHAFGIFGRLLVFFSGLACPVLFVTGVIRWLQKREGRQKHAP